ncbi:hypothetical protein SPAR_15186 [Streptomyces sparsogenes DSM 40356]|uniref:Uncharacterized protein n=2 Tax=Streptomyces sparsogenes TaxID=67365 RepID=A0A1R1SJZ9_9ACTN|nr:hypothetical protein SPAR_15186 [Streptomyces sparsogenes DSM 40356]
MTADEIDRFLSSMARASDLLLRESNAEEHRRDELNDLNEALIQRRANGQGSMADPDSVLLSVRLRLATDAATRQRNAAREFVSWWADAATVAWRGAALGTPVQYARLAGAAPETLLADEEFAALPKIDEHTRQLVELSASLASPPYPRPAKGDTEDLVAMTEDLASRSGLRIRVNNAGDVEAVEGEDPEARRCRLWGDFWVEHRIPALPGPEDLEELFTRAPSDIGTRLRAATKAVVGAVVAASRMDEMESKEAAWTAEEIEDYDRLMEQWCGLTVMLADYARIITKSLPALRSVGSEGASA